MIHRPHLDAAAAYVKSRWPNQVAEAAIICGSGWSSVLDVFKVQDRISYADIPHLGAPGVVGHAGSLCLCSHAGITLLVFQGRRHVYEGEGWTPIAIPIHLGRELGIQTLLLTNSAGAVNPAFSAGDLMIITDHLNLMGDNPLVGPHDPLWGPRFPDQSSIYQSEIARLQAAANQAGIPLQKGIYAATKGPVYETPAEIRAWRTLGADAVGMSTVPEAVLASSAGLRVGGLSCMTNMAAGILDQPLTHDEVTETATAAMPRMQALLASWAGSL